MVLAQNFLKEEGFECNVTELAVELPPIVEDKKGLIPAIYQSYTYDRHWWNREIELHIPGLKLVCTERKFTDD